MGDIRYSPFYAQVRDAENPAAELRKLNDEDVIAALAAASQASDPYLANILATEAQNRSLWKSRIIASMGDAVFIVSMPDRRILHANPAAERMFGFARAELLGQSTRVLHVDDEHYAEHGKRIQDALRTGTYLTTEFELKRRDGEVFPTEHTVSFISNQMGEVKGRVSLIRDITDRVHARNLLATQKRSLEQMVTSTMQEVRRRKKAEDRFRGLLRAAPDAILLVAEDGGIALASDQAERLFGYTKEEFEELTIEDLMPERFRAAHVRHRASYGDDPHPRPMGMGLELFARRKDGSEVPVEISLSPTETEDGRLVTAAIRDITVRKRMEAETREAHAKLRAVFEASPEPMVAVDREGTTTLWNPAAERVFGWTADEVIGQPNPLVPRERWGEHLGLVARVLAGETLEGIEAERQSKDGTSVPILLSAAPIRDAGGDITGAMAVVSDITHRKQAADELRRERDLIRRIMETSPSMITVMRRDGRIVFANDLAMEGLGITRDEIEGRAFNSPDWRITDYEGKPFPDEDLPFARVLATKAPVYDVQHAIERPDGTRVLLSINGAPVFDDEGEVDAVVFTLEDVTEKVRLDVQRYRLAAIVDSTDDAILGQTLDGQIVSWNPGAERLYGYTADEATGKPMRVLLPPDAPDDVDYILGKIRCGERIEHYETRRVRKDGRIVDVSLTVSPIRDAGGKIVGASSIARDVSDRKRAHEELQSLKQGLEQRVAERTRALEAANQELESFSYSVSHDLRAPLRAIDYFSQALEEDHAGDLDEEGRDFLRRVRDGAQRMTQQINDLLDLSRVTRGELRRERVDLTCLAWEVIEELRQHDTARHVEWVVHEGLEATADPRLLRLVLQNLLGNAWKYTSKLPGARIEFGARGSNGRAPFFVRDNGVGFDPADAHKLFAAFQRLHQDSEFEGTGVGLATVKRIIGRHGGRVWADGEPGKGATFSFTL